MKKIIEHLCYTLWLLSLTTFIGVVGTIGDGLLPISKLFPVIGLLITITAATYGLWYISEQDW